MSGSGFNWKTSDLWGAAITAEVIVDNDQVLRTLDGVTIEGNINGVINGVDLVDGNHNAINNSVGELQQGKLNIVSKISFSARFVEHNWNSSEGFVQLALERDGKSASTNGANTIKRERELDSLLLVLQGEGLVKSYVQYVIAIWAHLLRAVNITIGGVADTSTLFMSVPVSVVKCLW